MYNIYQVIYVVLSFNVANNKFNLDLVNSWDIFFHIKWNKYWFDKQNIRPWIIMSTMLTYYLPQFKQSSLPTWNENIYNNHFACNRRRTLNKKAFVEKFRRPTSHQPLFFFVCYFCLFVEILFVKPFVTLYTFSVPFDRWFVFGGKRNHLKLSHCFAWINFYRYWLKYIFKSKAIILISFQIY